MWLQVPVRPRARVFLLVTVRMDLPRLEKVRRIPVGVLAGIVLITVVAGVV